VPVHYTGGNHVVHQKTFYQRIKIIPEETEPLQNVISLRINDDEKKTLEKLTKTTSKSITEIMREAIDLWRARQRKLCMD